MHPHHFFVALALLVAGCGGSDDPEPATLTCEWLAGDNCWKAAIAEAAACGPSDADTGTISGDGASCSYASGHAVSFDEPLTFPVDSDGKEWRFTLTAGGTQCLRFVDSGSHTLTTASGTTRFGGDVGGIEIRCPSGEKFTNPDPFALLSCDGGLSGHPGYSTSFTDSSARFSLLGGPDGSQPIWSCSQ